MKRSMTLTLELSEKRQRLNELLGKAENLTKEERDEMDAATKRATEIGPELRACLVAEDGEEDSIRRQHGADAEGRELRSMLNEANVGRIFEAVVSHRNGMDGREDEIQKHFNLGANQVPLEMLRGPARKELRAVTTSPTDTGASQQEIILPVFAEGDAFWLNVAQPIVPVGAAVFPVLTSRPEASGPHTDSSEVGETTDSFSTDTLQPGRLQVSFLYRRADASRLAGMGEALRMALSSALSESLDSKLIAQIVTDVGRTDSSALATFSSYRSSLYERLDGRFAPMESDLRLLAGASTISHMALQYRTDTSGDDSVLDSIRRVSGGVRVSAHIAPIASKKQDTIIRRGSREDAIAAPWYRDRRKGGNTARRRRLPIGKRTVRSRLHEVGNQPRAVISRPARIGSFLQRIGILDSHFLRGCCFITSVWCPVRFNQKQMGFLLRNRSMLNALWNNIQITRF